MPDPLAINLMFGRIAHRYDLTNKVLSGGIDVYWRFRLIRAVQSTKPMRVLDLATGSGDVAFALAQSLPPSVSIIGMDFCAPMLKEAEAKRGVKSAIRAQIEFREGDALALPLPDESFDAVTIAFGLRNMADRAVCLSEMRRVLRPGGRLVVLEFSRPWGWVRPLYAFHLRYVVPGLAAFLTGDREAYEYLGSSINAFPDRAALCSEILAAGYSSVSATPLTFGVVALHTAVR